MSNGVVILSPVTYHSMPDNARPLINHPTAYCQCESSNLFQIHKCNCRGRTHMAVKADIWEADLYHSPCPSYGSSVQTSPNSSAIPSALGQPLCAALSSPCTRSAQRHARVRAHDETSETCRRREGSCCAAYRGAHIHTDHLPVLLYSYLSYIS